MIENKKIAKRYARAFLHGEVKTDEIDKLIEEVRELDIAIQADASFREFLTSPAYSKAMKDKVMSDLCGKLGFSGYTRSLVRVMIKKDRMNIVSDVHHELVAVSDRLHERVRISLVTASEPSAAEIDDITGKISAHFGRKAVIDRSIDESIVGGFIVEGDGTRIDMSIRGQIDRMLADI